jgi:hypothetical protein
VHEFALLILNGLIEILDGNVIPFAEDFSAASSSWRRPLAEPYEQPQFWKWLKAEGVN